MEEVVALAVCHRVKVVVVLPLRRPPVQAVPHRAYRPHQVARLATEAIRVMRPSRPL